jgi:urease accessory protein
MECGGKASLTSGDTALAMKRAGQAPARVRSGEPKRRCHFIPRRTPYSVHGPNSSALAQQEWLVWQLADSAFPTGGFAHSNGLEAAWHHGAVRQGHQLAAFVRASLHQAGHSLLPFVSDAHAAPERLSEFDQLCDALTSNHVANRASRFQGRALLAAARRIFIAPRDSERLDASKEQLLRQPVPCGHLAPVFGAVASVLDLARETAQRLFLFGHLRGLIAAAVRLNIVGPLEAQAIQRGLAGSAEQVLRSSSALTSDDIAQTAPLLDLWQGTHDRLGSRLFQS